jgi:hypothetical protein
MSAQPATLLDPAPAAPAPSAAAAARLLIDEQLQMLRRVAQVGLAVSLEIERQARGDLAEGGKPAALGDVALAYARTTRAMRLTVMLQARLARDLEGLDEAGAQAGQARLDSEQARKGSVERIVGRVAEAAGEGEDRAEDLVLEASERLNDDDLYGDVLARPVSEIVADICADLHLSPDWGRLAAEAWAQAEIAGGAAGAPLRGLVPGVRRPPPPPPHPGRPAPPRAAAPGAQDDPDDAASGPMLVSWLPSEKPLIGTSSNGASAGVPP